MAADAVLTVTGTAPVPTTPPNPTLPNPTPSNPAPIPNPTATSPIPGPGPDDAVPVGLVVGSSLLGVALLAGLGGAFLTHRHRGPRWVHGHISSRLRPTAAATEVAEPSDSGPPTHSVRLEPHPDPGDQTVEEDS
ncbi:hypothetical protein [Streptomyces sp. NPDC097981]|uniref:hypothetical protein n=1 Tax=Streptomyces sp. NPDC097981 TaxID=3155428 RepID=UPI0033292924